MSTQPPAFPAAPPTYDADYLNRTLRILTQHLSGQAQGTAYVKALYNTGLETKTAVGTQEIISQDASVFYEGQQSTLTSGSVYTTLGNQLAMKLWTHNFRVDTSGNIGTANATDYCAMMAYREDDKLMGWCSSAAVTAGNTPTLANTWYIDNITGNIWNNGLITQGDTTAPAGLIQLGGMFSTSTANGANLILRKSITTATNNANLVYARSRGTNASPTALVSGDSIGSLVSAGFDGTNYIIASSIGNYVDGTISTGIVPGRISFTTANSSGTLTEALRIDSAQNVLVTAPSGLGYGTGAGGTVTQATSKSTSVTLNKPTGQITMNNAALAAGASIIFSVVNSLSSQYACWGVAGYWGAVYAGSYRIEIANTYLTGFDIRVTNITAGSLSEALQINFVLLKGSPT